MFDDVTVAPNISGSVIMFGYEFNNTENVLFSSNNSSAYWKQQGFWVQNGLFLKCGFGFDVGKKVLNRVRGLIRVFPNGFVLNLCMTTPDDYFWILLRRGFDCCKWADSIERLVIYGRLFS